MKVIALRDTVYEVEFQDITLNEKVKVESDVADMSSMEQMLGKLIADMQEKMRGFTYVLIVDRASAQAQKVKNERAMASFIEGAVMVVLKAFFDESKLQLAPNESRELELQLKKIMKEQMPAAMQTVVNGFNYIFQSYAVPYVPGRTHATDIEMYYIDAIK